MGQPIPGYAGIRPDENIVRYEPTKGIETSQYLQEKKAIEIPLVAASERG